MFKNFIGKLKKGSSEKDIVKENEDEEILENQSDIVLEEAEHEEFDLSEEAFLEADMLEEVNSKDIERCEENPTNDKESKDNERAGFFSKLKAGLSKTRQGIAGKVDQVLKSYKKIDEDLFEEIEEILITSDTGVKTTMEIIEKLRSLAKERKITEAQEIRGLLKEILTEMLELGQSHELKVDTSPAIILVVGVNGVGKTTSIGKIAHSLKKQGKRVMLAAGDTFRAAAIDQLEIWGNRVGIDVIKHQEGSDPAAVIFDAIQSAKARKIDVLICDTAGRLHNKKNLMNELGKVVKVVEREYVGASKEILLVLDATTGQNALQQAKTFKEITDITGIVLTKLDGTAKGGVVLAISNELKVPVKLIGVGEGMNDLQAFVPVDFVNALFAEDE